MKMSQKSSVPPTRVAGEKLVRDIRRATRKLHSARDICIAATVIFWLEE
jgi:hypothetical protein